MVMLLKYRGGPKKKIKIINLVERLRANKKSTIQKARKTGGVGLPPGYRLKRLDYS